MRFSAVRKFDPEQMVVAIPDEFYTDLPVGEILRRARLSRGMPIEQAERQLHIRAAHLSALERSDFHALPGRVYVIGFIRTYAEYLGLDGDRVVHLLKRQSRGLGTPQSLNMHYLPSETRLPSVPLVVIVFVIFLIVMTVWGVYQGVRMGMPASLPPVPSETLSLHPLDRQEQVLADRMDPVLTAASPVPVALKEVIDRAAAGDVMGHGISATLAIEEESPIPVPPIRVQVTNDSWIELRNPEGRVVQARLFRAGEEISLDNPVDNAGNPFRISVGNAGGVQILVNGKLAPTLGSDAQVRRNISLDPAAFHL